jgi:hopene-associated glycosyltransferase HpnB
MLAALMLAAWVYLLLLHGKFWQSGPELPPMVPAFAPPVAVVVPARDEAETIAASLGSLRAQDYPGPLQIVLVDDSSSDGTADIAARVQGITILAGQPRPAGWAGKLWAVAQGIERVTPAPEFFLLTDADITHDPRHIATLVAHAERHCLDMVSEMVALNCESLAERALVPAFVYFFQLLYPFAKVNDPLSAVAGAAGGTILIRRRALVRIGGIAAIQGALIDDCALAAKVKPGGRIWLGHSGLARSIRLYPDFADIWRMVARSAYVQLGLSPALLVASTLGLALIFLLPPYFALFATGWAQLAGVLGWAAMAGSFLPTLGRYRQPIWWAALLPLIAAFYLAATIGSAIDHHRGRGVVWKRRSYERPGA